MRRRITLAAAAVSAALALGLGGCAAQPSPSADLRDSVVQIAQRASVEDFTGAMAELLLLERAVDASVAEGELDDAREAEIRAAIELVRDDLTAAASPTPTPTPTPTEADIGDEDDNSGPGNSDDKGKSGKKDKGEGNDDD